MRDQLNTPLQTLRLGLELSTNEGEINRVLLARLGRAVDRLMQLGRSLRP